MHLPQGPGYHEVPLARVSPKDPGLQLDLFFLAHLLHQVPPVKIYIRWKKWHYQMFGVIAFMDE